MLFSTTSLLLIGSFLQGAVSAARILPRDGPSPALPFADDTTKYCSWWLDYESVGSCVDMLEANYINLEEFRRWNPSVNAACGNLAVGKSYCIETTDEPAASAPASASSSAALTSASSLRSSVGNNGIETPLPTQPGMVSNCAGFHYIGPNTVCSQVLSYQKISVGDLYRWNPSVNADCTGLQKMVNVCVRVIGATTTTPKPSTTITSGNGIQTPQPTQPGMVANCNKFHFINQGVVCTQVTSYQKITREDFVKWNPTVKDDCSGMWADVNVCVGVIGGGLSPTPTTSAGNGIQTPQPTQPGMILSCKKFHYAAAGVVCSQLTSYNMISLADFVKWNPGVGSDCRTMWANTFFCVGV
ncbi:LysM domain-containing protein [Boeremia exigua]|uniref:LysM domain-containing protein n=1 Tax=Boeremia exigua TaxID=749465 RepID=UPI001E8DE9A7|nr:LysM domain-containing protein [Boeremia exigua]KAH6625097.1 LysM domain-containing protein [Boeremia exigua]